VKEEVRRVDVIMYLMTLSISAFRFAQDELPFDFEETATAEFMGARTLPFIHQEDIEYKRAHESFLQTMFENGWQHGDENFSKRTHPDLVAWEELPKKTQELYAYAAALVSSAKEFYESLKADLLKDFMDNLPALALRGKLIIPDSKIFRKATH